MSSTTPIPGSTAKTTSAGLVNAKPLPDVAVFVSGLADRDFLEPAHIAEVICNELRKSASDSAVGFAVTKNVGLDNKGNPDPGTVEHRVERSDAAGTTPVLDLHHVTPRGIMDGAPAGDHPLKKVLTLLPILFGAVLVFGNATFGRNKAAKSLPQKAQLLVCLVILLVLATYFIVAFLALISAIMGALYTDEPPTIAWPQWVVLVTTVLVFLLPNWKEKLENASEIYVRMMRYVWTGRDRNQVVGNLRSRLDFIAQGAEVQRIHVIGYSFGSLIALDCLYPSSSASPAAVHKIDSITTIGCPFDLIRMLRPSYAVERSPAAGTPLWLNIYAPLDLLASNFGDGDKVRPTAETGLIMRDSEVRKPDYNETWNSDTTLNLENFLMLPSLQVHVDYWDNHPTSDTAFGLLVRRVFRTEQHILS